MRMAFVFFFIIFMLLIFVFIAGIVYWAISYANKHNKEYLAFANAHGYHLTKLKVETTIGITQAERYRIRSL